MAAGTMVKLAAATGGINTSDQLNIFEAYQKVFMVNGANFKVADFINMRLTHITLGTAHAHGDLLTQDQGGGAIAYMVVDFTNATKTLTYGYAYYSGSATAFNASTAITGSGSGTGFTPTAVTAGPHWYDWTVYPGSSGELPNKAYLGCLYRGRAVISGNPEYPYQWYMSRQANPWDFAYVANDAQTPVKGGNSDAGEIGDIVTALIPYKDDYLVFGCSTSVWFLTGDPAEGGSLNELDLTVGIFGANSWCWDGDGNLYFWGTNGVYKTAIPGRPLCISEIRLPSLINDETANSSTHRITMVYGRKRAGILICITKLSDGTNSNYWLDLRTNGFFPETYPEECSSYSAFYYDASDTTYRDLLIGCKDGYIRKFDSSAKEDDIGGTNEAIDSYVKFGPIPMSSSSFLTGKLTELFAILAGGAPGGSQSDSDDLTFKVFVADDAETIIEKLSADTTPNISGVFSAPGRRKGSTVRKGVRGVYMGIKIGNATAAETWALEQLIYQVKDSGRVR